jgi:hypothetical protein
MFSSGDRSRQPNSLGQPRLDPAEECIVVENTLQNIFRRCGVFLPAGRALFSGFRGKNCFSRRRGKIFPSGANGGVSRKPKKREKFAGVRPQTY